MKRPRTYTQRGKTRRVEELTDVVALRPTAAEASPVRANVAEVSPDQLSPFEEAGWVFASRTDSDGRADHDQTASVFLKENGNVALCPNRLTLQWNEGVTDDQANQLLNDHRIEVVEKLKFAPNLVRVRLLPDATKDALDVAQAMVDSGKVTFAEPELIEQTGLR